MAQTRNEPAIAPAAPAMPRPTRWYLLVVFSALVGMAATTTQIIERISIAENPAGKLFCDINGVFSCGSVLTAWQSSVFGDVPNAAIGLVVFTMMLTYGLGGALGMTPTRRYWGVVAFFIGFMAAFTVWYFAETALVIGKLCLFCVANGTAVVLINAALWRTARAHGFLAAPPRALGAAGFLVRNNSDLLIWGGLWVAVAALSVLGLSLG